VLPITHNEFNGVLVVMPYFQLLLLIRRISSIHPLSGIGEGEVSEPYPKDGLLGINK
tara:strand:- start:41 stop:211 length:171 start_codon:yes stop_codon:yes gene_type:complete